MKDVKLARKHKICEILGVCPRTIDNYAALYEGRRAVAADPKLPSSPRNGLCSIRVGAPSHGALPADSAIKLVDTRQRRFDERDAWEYVANSTLEALQLPLENWRRETRRACR